MIDEVDGIMGLDDEEQKVEEKDIQVGTDPAAETQSASGTTNYLDGGKDLLEGGVLYVAFAIFAICVYYFYRRMRKASKARTDLYMV